MPCEQDWLNSCERDGHVWTRDGAPGTKLTVHSVDGVQKCWECDVRYPDALRGFGGNTTPRKGGK